MLTTESREPGTDFRSRIWSIIRRKAPEQVLKDSLDSQIARERARTIYDRLVQEREERKSDAYEVYDQDVAWEIDFITRESTRRVVDNFFTLRREELDKAGNWFLPKKDPVVHAETFNIHPTFIGYMDFTSARFKYHYTNSPETLGLAERIMISLFPDFVPFKAESSQSPIAPALVNS